MGVLNMTVFKEKITPGSAVEGLIKDVQIRKGGARHRRMDTLTFFR